jgi:hypothetical protein
MKLSRPCALELNTGVLISNLLEHMQILITQSHIQFFSFWYDYPSKSTQTHAPAPQEQISFT